MKLKGANPRRPPCNVTTLAMAMHYEHLVIIYIWVSISSFLVIVNHVNFDSIASVVGSIS
jgi:hypothetical protein